MKRVLSWALGIAGYVVLWVAVGDKPILSREGILLLVGGVLIAMGSSAGTAADWGKWPWQAPWFTDVR